MKFPFSVLLFGLLAAASHACITVSTATFFNVSTDSLTARWDSSCSTGTIFYAQASEQASFSSPIAPAGASVSTGTLFNGLQAGTLYYVRASTVPSMAAATVLGSTVTALWTAGSPQTAVSGPASVAVAPGTFSQNYALLLSNDPVGNPVGPPGVPLALSQATEKSSTNSDDVRRRPVPGGLLEVRARDAGGGALTPLKPLTVNLTYNESNGYVQGMAPLIRPETLSIYGLDETARLWVRLPSEIDFSARTVTTETSGFAVFALMGRTDTALDGIYAYPQPYSPGKGLLTFMEVSQDAVVRLYNSSGVLLQTLQNADGSNRLTWNGADRTGAPLPTGVYYYVIQSATEKRRGKLMVVR